MNLGIVVASTRPGRVGEQIADWVGQQAASFAGVTVDMLDLAEIDLPFLDEEREAASGLYTRPHTLEWSRRVGSQDAFLLLTPEYNSSFPGSLKNALDFLYDEWQRKPVGVVAYGMTSAGTRAIAALMPVLVALGMVPAGYIPLALRQRLDLDGVLHPTPDDDTALIGLLTELTELSALLGSARVPV